MDTKDARTRGEVVRQARLSANKTQKLVAAAAEVHERTVMRAEQDREISSENLMAICAVIGLDASKLPPSSAVDPVESPDLVEALEDEGDDGRAEVVATPTLSWVRIGMHTAAMFAMILTAAAAGYYAAYPSAEANGREISLSIDFSAAETTVKRVNQIAYAMADGDEAGLDAAIRMIRSRNIGYVCFGRLRENGDNDCVERPNRNDVSIYGEGSYLVTLGAMSQAAFDLVVQRLTADPRITFEATVSTGRSTPGEGQLWFDPRGVATRNLPAFPEDGLLHIKVSRT